MNPDRTLIELSGELWPHLGYPMRRYLCHRSNVTKLLPLVKNRPWVLATILAHKTAPLAVATLYELTMAADKENVRVTAAKELVRLAQSTYTKMQASPDEPVPTEELDELLELGGTPELEEEIALTEQDELGPEQILLLDQAPHTSTAS